MNYKLMTSAIALGFAATGVMAQDQDAGTFGASAGVALISPEQTGYMFGASVGVNGVGSAAANVTRSRASHTFTGYADSRTGDNNVMESNSGVLGAFTFERDVTVNGSLVGLGTVVAEGSAQGMSGFTGSASAFGENGLTYTVPAEGETPASTESLTSLADTQSEAALTGSASTRANLTLTGSEDRFAAANGTSLGETTQGLAISALGASANDFGVTVPGFDVGVVPTGTYMTDQAKSLFDGSALRTQLSVVLLDNADAEIDEVNVFLASDGSGNPIYVDSAGETVIDSSGNLVGDAAATSGLDDFALANAVVAGTDRQQGVFFSVDAQPTSNEIDLAISNAGGGSIGLTAQTGGFFSGGASGFGEFEFGGTNAADFFQTNLE